MSNLAWLGRLAQGDLQGVLSHTERAITQLDAFHGEFYVWEQPDVLMCRTEVLAAAGKRPLLPNKSPSGRISEQFRRARRCLAPDKTAFCPTIFRTDHNGYQDLLRVDVSRETIMVSCYGKASAAVKLSSLWIGAVGFAVRCHFTPTAWVYS